MNTYKVTDFGIQPGIAVPQTALLQQLIDRCKAEGGGKIVFPAGSYVSGSLVLCSNLVFCKEVHFSVHMAYISYEHVIPLVGTPEL